MNVVERGVRAIDRFQQRHLVTAYLFAVQKKVGDDNGGQLISNLAYSAFVTVFPLLLLLITLLGLIVGTNASAAHAVEHSALSQFPILGNQLLDNVHALHRTSPFTLVAGIVGLIWGATGLAQTGLYTMAQVWNVPGVDRLNFLKRLLRSLGFLAALGLTIAASGFLSAFGTFSSHHFVIAALSELASVAVNFGAFLLAFRILTPPRIPTRQLPWGALVGGIAWTVVEAVGGYLVGHDLKNASQVYGFFAYVLGLLAWLYLGARITVYTAEINTVLSYRLWPRSIVQPPLTDADRRALALQVTENARRPEQLVTVSYADPADHPPDHAATSTAGKTAADGAPAAASQPSTSARPHPD